jgi:predicted nucleic acid-binding protein
MKENYEGHLLDTNVCIAYINACAKERLKWTFEQKQVFEKIKSELQKLGKPMADMDTIIAATAKRYNLILATADADMKNLDYLKSIAIARENWINVNET